MPIGGDIAMAEASPAIEIVSIVPCAQRRAMSKLEAFVVWLAMSIGALISAYMFRDPMGQAVDNCYWLGAGVLASWFWVRARKPR